MTWWVVTVTSLVPFWLKYSAEHCPTRVRAARSPFRKPRGPFRQTLIEAVSS